MEQLLQIAINHQHVRPSRWKDRKGAFDQALHLIRLQLLERLQNTQTFRVPMEP